MAYFARVVSTLYFVQSELQAEIRVEEVKLVRVLKSQRYLLEHFAWNLVPLNPQDFHKFSSSYQMIMQTYFLERGCVTGATYLRCHTKVSF